MAMDMFEMFQIYVDKLPEMVRHVQDLGAKADPEDIAFAWWVLIYRGLVWYLSVPLIGPNDGSSDGRSGTIYHMPYTLNDNLSSGVSLFSPR
ncbi:hypothetical protein N3K66_006461 [Trichothecium roseum]|uniref:Uncharacterized protein n=1 Tax=Trichothecium roseum TaxID=47278 RepID=A0ACC0UVF4_9HYPO|nr:hypothetical protein N3K66_006461 [Trichothecium roseum]